ncbi:MAG TPA: ATP-dependent helicase [Bacteroidia bacterium]|nr:ATP-dependent helicase [Bacteroidia bacterium]
MESQETKPEQEEIHKIQNGPTLILAGPGTGKTHSMALRVKWLIEEMHCDPNEITIITFTTEAKLNMRHRISDETKNTYMPRENQPNQISTMHSLGHQIISSQLPCFGLTNDFNVVQDAVKKLIFEDAAQIAGLDRKKGISASMAKQQAKQNNDGDEFLETKGIYNQILRACNALDYDDQLIIACEILRNNKELLSTYQNQAKHLLVDEFQDINLYQFELIKLLVGENANGLFVVGDDDQSIYSFRGGSPEYVRKFKEHFGDKSNIHYLSKCHRCPPAILNAAVAVVRKFNPDRAAKPDLSSVKELDTLIQFLDSPTQEKEAEKIASKCAQVSASHDVLILVPQMTFAKPIISALRKKRIGYDCKSVVSKGGLDVLDNLGDWLEDTSSSFALRELIDFLLQSDQYGIPSNRARTPEKIVLRDKMLSEISFLWIYVIEKKCSLYEALKVRKDSSEVLSKLYETLQELIAMYESQQGNFLEAIGRIMKPWVTPKAMFQEVEIWLNEVRGQGVSGKANVRIMTMGMAKGLEADYVFVIGMDELIFPKAKIPPEEVQEKSRLAYVSMTRAEIELWLCHARTRSASITYLPESFALKESPFVKAIKAQPKKLMNPIYIESQDAEKKKTAVI